MREKREDVCVESRDVFVDGMDPCPGLPRRESSAILDHESSHCRYDKTELSTGKTKRVKPIVARHDFWNGDETTDSVQPAHISMLPENILVIEPGSTLAHRPVNGCEFHAVPLRIAPWPSFPVPSLSTIRVGA